jgi:UTP:GlnB (protein PII) uridylyltransferase
MPKFNISNITISNITSNKLLNVLPEFYSLKNNIENNPWHLNQTTFNHTILVLQALEKNIKKYKNLEKYLNQKVEKNTRRDILFLATLFHDIAKPQCQIISKEKWIIFPNHEKESAILAKKILKNFDLTSKEINLITKIIKNHDKFQIITNGKNVEENFKKEIKKLKSHFIELLLLNKSDTEGSNINDLMPEIYIQKVQFFHNKLINLKI